MTHKNIWQALAEAQKNFGKLETTGRNPFHKSEYATLGDIHKATRKALLAAGLVVTHAPGIEDGQPYVECTIAHVESGETIAERCPLYLSKQDMQGIGAGISYARRYLMLSMLDLDMDGLDDDGESIKQSAPTKRPTQPSPPQRNGSAPKHESTPFDDDAPAWEAWVTPDDAFQWAVDNGMCNHEKHARNALKKIVDGSFDGKLTKENFSTVMAAFYTDRVEKQQAAEAEQEEPA